MKKIVCIYAYYEKNEEYKENLRFFLKNGIVDSCDYIFIINGDCTVDIPDKHKKLYRTNKGFDFGAYSYASENMNLTNYDYLFFINTSVRGPYIQDWQNSFINLLKDDIKLVGTVINIHTRGNHVSSMVFLIDNECYTFLKKNKFFSIENDVTNYEDAINNKEILMSTLILNNGWNITCIAEKYQGYDYRILKEDINKTSINGDSMFENAYFGKTLTQDDVIFIKTTKDRNLSYPNSDTSTFVNEFEFKEKNIKKSNILLYTLLFLLFFQFFIIFWCIKVKCQYHI